MPGVENQPAPPPGAARGEPPRVDQFAELAFALYHVASLVLRLVRGRKR